MAFSLSQTSTSVAASACQAHHSAQSEEIAQKDANSLKSHSESHLSMKIALKIDSSETPHNDSSDHENCPMCSIHCHSGHCLHLALLSSSSFNGTLLASNNMFIVLQNPNLSNYYNSLFRPPIA